jgi:hypothetical protein
LGALTGAGAHRQQGDVLAQSAPVGYSGTPLPRKLGLKDGQVAAFVDLPENLGFLRQAVAFAGVADITAEMIGRQHGGLDVLHVFTTSRATLVEQRDAMRAAIRPEGTIWISWPKKAAKVSTDITEDVLRAVLLPTGLVDVKVCAVDEIWSGLKFVVRKELRQR